MARLTKAEILAAAIARTEDVAIPEWGGGTVAVRMLTGTERDAMFAAVKRREDGTLDMRDYRCRLLAASCVDPDNAAAPLFSLDDAATLDDTAAPAMLRLVSAAQRINGLAPESVESARGN